MSDPTSTKTNNGPFIVKTLAKFSQSITENLYEKANKQDKERILKMKYLYFEKGDKIKVFKSPKHGWWYGKLVRNYTDIFDETDSR